MKSYSPDTAFGYMYTVTYTLEIWPGDKVALWLWDEVIPHLESWTTIVWNIIGSNIVRSRGLDTDFGYVYTVTLALEIWPLVKVMTHPWVIGNTCVKWYPEPKAVRSCNPLKDRLCVHCEIRDMTLSQGHYTSLSHGQQLCEILFRFNMAAWTFKNHGHLF